MTTYWCYFPLIIANNISSVYRILSKLSTKMRHYTTFLCTKFQGNRITCFHFMVTLTPSRKEERKKKKLSQFLEVHISDTPGTIYLKFGIWVLKLEGISTAKIIRFHTSSMKVRIRENRIIVLPVNILTGVVRRLLGQHDTLLCVLI